jgi:YggT family protein
MLVMNPFVALFSTVISLIWWAMFIWFVLSLLIQFNIVNRWNPFVNRVYSILERAIEPLLRPIRRYVPTWGGIDFSPLILILLLQFLQNAIFYYG